MSKKYFGTDGIRGAINSKNINGEMFFKFGLASGTYFKSQKKIDYLRMNGIDHNNIILDPGIGFGKNLKHNMNLISNISIFHSLGFPILVGNSRKKFIKDLCGKNDSKKRLGGTVASSLYAIMQGVQVLRIHDVNELRQSIKVFKKLIKINDKKIFWYRRNKRAYKQ